MRGGLDETLDRMRRREEALRRRSTEPNNTGADQPGSEPGGSPGSEPGWAEPRDSEIGRAGAHEPAHEAPPRHVVEDVAEALREAVAAHPGAAVTARVEQDGQAYDLRVAWTDQEVTTTAQPAAATPAWPMSLNAVPGPSTGQDGLGEDPAARLADLIRRDPSLLGGEEPPD
ncbi:hypothetical protein [Micromonospora sp. LOL_024]|uniref:hypothetical protein n=1 Tax=Micromonospora sp. LOL_024 TaxID=3345412 RepID=UPI003A85BC98